MITTTKVHMDLTQYTGEPVIPVMQDDRYSRNLELSVYADDVPWTIPEGVTVLIRYSKPDGKGGEYDTMPDGSAAWQAAENVLTIALAPQVLTVPGAVTLTVTLMKEHIQISTYSVILNVHPAANAQIGESEVYFHVPGFLPAPGSAEAGQYLQIASVDSAGHVTALRAVTEIDGTQDVLEPKESDIPKVFFGSALAATRDECVMSFRYVSKTRDIRGYCKTKAQGSSSMDYPKKNQTVTLYCDADCTETLKVDFKGWGLQSKFCFKANWIDLTHARNIVSARLWGDMVKSRQGYEEIPELLRTSPNQGAVDGFPVKVYANGVYQGRYTINIPKDGWMANMDDSLDTHCILCGENYESGCFRAEALIDGSDWTDELHDTVPDAIRDRWNEAIRFVMDSTDEEFVSGIGNYFDLNSLVDYCLFGLASCGLDAFGKNQLYMTFDGQKWYATMYDMDSTWGLWWDGTSFVSTSYDRNEYQDFQDGSGNLLYIRLEALFREEILSRWEELKAGALTIDNIINRFERFTDIASDALVAEDYAATTGNGGFTEIPSQDTNNIQQIRAYARARLAWTDTYLNGDAEEISPVYAISSGTVFDGVDDYVDTGIALFDAQKDFTVLCDAVLSEDAAANSGIYTAYRNASGGEYTHAGFQCLVHYDGYGQHCLWGLIDDGSYEIFAIIPTAYVKHAVVCTNGVPTAVYYADSEGTVRTVAFEKTPAYGQHDYTLSIGHNSGWYQDRAGFVPMTVNAFEIYDYAMSAEEAAAKLTK